MADSYDYLNTDTRSIEELTEAIRLNPNDVENYVQRGTAFAIKAENKLDNENEESIIRDYYDRAIADFSAAIRLKPNHAELYRYRGVIYSRNRKAEQAIADYDKAIELDPNCANAYAGRGMVYLGKKDFDNAFTEWKKALEIDPENNAVKNCFQSLGILAEEFEDTGKVIKKMKEIYNE